MTFWTRTYSRHQNNIYRHFRKRSLFCFWCNGLYLFSEELHCFWIPSDPCSHGGIIQLPFIRRSSDYCYMSITSTSITLHMHITYICAYFLPKQSPKKLRTYIRPILPTYYVFVPHFLNSEFLHSLSLYYD